MSKAILVMDMPKNCNECDVICMKYYSAIRDGDLEILTKPDGCPLKEMPQKDDSKYYLDDDAEAFVNGYNACIDSILKGSEENEIDRCRCDE